MLDLKSFKWMDLGKMDLLDAGHQLNARSCCLRKLKMSRLKHKSKTSQPYPNSSPQEEEKSAVLPVKENVTFDEFMKMDIRVGTVLECTKVPKADKLLQFKLDDGMGGRTILSGIAAYYPNPEELVGSQVLFIANFPPRKLRGIDSEGMILSAENPDGTLTLIRPSEKLANGSAVV